MFHKPKRTGDDFHHEIDSHIQIEADRLVEQGMSRADAVDAARRSFGNVTSSRERFYEAGRWIWLDHLARDIRFAFRQMKSSPVATATIILSLALGVGVNTAIFSLADQTLWRGLPVADPGRVVQLEWNGRFIGGGSGWGSLLPYPFVKELRAENDLFSDVFGSAPIDLILTAGEVSEPVTGEVVTGSYFAALGVQPALGRLIGDSDDITLGAHPVVVLSHDYWRTRMASDPQVIGKHIAMNGYPMQVIGVAEPGFQGVDWATVPSIWIPAAMTLKATPGWDELVGRRNRFLHTFARLKPGLDPAQAQAQIQPWFKAYLEAETQREGWPQVTAQQMREYRASKLDLLPGEQPQSRLRSQVDDPLRVLLAATGLIVLLACLNVANLSLARTLARRRATALRAALGASRRRIVMEQLVESAVLATLGCAAGVLLARPVSAAIVAFLPHNGTAGMALSTDIDLRVLAFALGVAVLTTLLSGLAPALYAAGVQPVNALKMQSTAVAGGFGLRRALVVGQFALALILLVGAGLFTRTLSGLRQQGPGFPTANLFAIKAKSPAFGPGSGNSKATSRHLLEAIQALPEVEHAAVATRLILTGGSWNNRVTIAVGGERIASERSLPMNAVSPDFFNALNVKITHGRAFDERDTHDDEKLGVRSAIVNEEFVHRYLSGKEPLAARIGTGDGPNVKPDTQIVGVVQTFQDLGLREHEPHVFYPMWEMGYGGDTFYVRSRGSSESAAAAVRAAVSQADPLVTITEVRTLDDQLDRMLAGERMLAILAVVFAVIATLLAMIGLYGVLSFSAARRTKEIGIRLALGAPRWSAGGLIVREAAVLACAGLAIALPASWALGRLIENRLFAVSPMDAASFASAAAVLALVCFAASFVPARKAGAVNPLDALRME